MRLDIIVTMVLKPRALLDIIVQRVPGVAIITLVLLENIAQRVLQHPRLVQQVGLQIVILSQV